MSPLMNSGKYQKEAGRLSKVFFFFLHFDTEQETVPVRCILAGQKSNNLGNSVVWVEGVEAGHKKYTYKLWFHWTTNCTDLTSVQIRIQSLY